MEAAASRFARMEELVRSLRNLELALPRGEQITSLVDADPTTEKQLAQELAVPARLDTLNEEDVGSAMLDAALLSGATEAILQNYNRALQADVDALQREHAQTSAPKRVKALPFKALLAQQDASIRRRAREREASTGEDGTLYMPRQISDTVHTYSSAAPISALTSVDMAEFEAPKRLAGRYVLLRVVSRLSLYVSCSFVGELPSGAAIPVSIAYFTPDLLLQGDALDAMLPQGTVLLVREPYISTNYLGVGGPSTGGKGTVGIRVDTPADVQVMDTEDPLVQQTGWGAMPSALPLWRQEGPLARSVGRQRAQSENAPLVVPACANRSDARTWIERFLAQDRPGAAWREMQAADLFHLWVAEGPERVDDVLLRADVLVALRASKAAAACLDTLPEAYTARRSALAESVAIGEHGPSDRVLQHMFQTTLENPTPRFPYAEFVGPVAVQDIPGAGRGLVLTRDVAEGELVLMCRAIGSTYSADAACAGVPLLRCNPDNGVTSTTTQVLAATRCIHAMLDRPELAHPFLGLTAGPELAYSTYVAEPFPLHVAHEAEPLAAIQAGLHPPDIDAAYVNGVLRFNAFGPAAMPAAASGNDPMSRSTMPHPLPAILNHACLPNVSSVFFGDLVTTRALSPLPKGTEIVHQYVQGELPYATRQSLLSKHGFQCGCTLCTLDAADGAPALQQRRKLLATVLPPLLDRSRTLWKLNQAQSEHDAREAHREVAASFRDLYNALRGTYAATRPALRPDLVDILHRVAQHEGVYDPGAGIASLHASLQAAGAELTDAAMHGAWDTDTPCLARLPLMQLDGVIQCMLTLSALHTQRRAALASRAWIAAAVHTHTCMIGGGTPLFLQRYGECDAAGVPRGEHAAPLAAYLATRS